MYLSRLSFISADLSHWMYSSELLQTLLGVLRDSGHGITAKEGV